MHPQDTTPHKTCPKCGESKPATIEFFSRSNRRASGFDVYCKICQKAYRDANKERQREYDRARWAATDKERERENKRAYREANKEQISKRKHQYYLANQEAEKARTKAWIEANKEHVIERRRAYYEAKREQITAKNRAHYAANGEKFAAYRAANRERRIEQMRAWHEANKEHVKEYARIYDERNKERKAKNWRVWYVANRESVYARAKFARHARRARIRSAKGNFTIKDVEAQFARQKGKCYYCGSKVGDTYHVDHIVPLSRGGSNGPENIVIACPPCNLSKGNKLPHEWSQGGRLL